MIDVIPVLPLGLAYLASVLLRDGYDVSVIDAQMDGKDQQVLNGDLLTLGLSWNGIKDKIEGCKPDIVGVTCLFSSRFPNALHVAKLVKEIDPEIPVVLGGIQPTVQTKEVLANSEVDFAVLGEGEQTMLDLMNGKSHRVIDGFGYKEDGQIHINPKTKFIEDLDSLLSLLDICSHAISPLKSHVCMEDLVCTMFIGTV
ncbi:MAG: cobalamin-dependent protein [Candidatus Bathyarchaeia archaeon]